MKLQLENFKSVFIFSFVFVSWFDKLSGHRPRCYRGFNITFRHTTVGGTPLDK